MYGFDVKVGYMGWMPDSKRYELFATESEYIEAFREANKPYAEITYLD